MKRHGHHNGGSARSLCVDEIRARHAALLREPPSAVRKAALRKIRGQIRQVEEYRSVWPEILP